MVLPAIRGFMRLILEAVQDGSAHTTEDLCSVLAQILNLSSDNQAEILPGGSLTVFRKRVEFAKSALQTAGLIACPVQGTLVITEAGKQILEENSESVDLQRVFKANNRNYMVQKPWSDQEAALLLRALIDVLQNKTNRKTAISVVSKTLRQLAVRKGMVIDEKFRNENGIALMMYKLEYVFTKGRSGLFVQNGWFFKIVDIYKNKPKNFELLWKSAIYTSNSTITQWRYFSWLSDRVTLAQLTDLYLVYGEISEYFIERKVLKDQLLQTTDLTVLLEIRNTIVKNELFRATHAANISNMSFAIECYVSFVRESGYPSSSPQIINYDSSLNLDSAVVIKNVPTIETSEPVELSASKTSLKIDEETYVPSAEPKDSFEKSSIAENLPISESIVLQPENETDVRTGFVRWMLSSGETDDRIRVYVSSLKQIEGFAKKAGFFIDIFSVVNVSELKSLQARLNLQPEFVFYNAERQYCFSNALRKYIKYCEVKAGKSNKILHRMQPDKAVAAKVKTQNYEFPEIKTGDYMSPEGTNDNSKSLKEKTDGYVTPEVAQNYLSLLRDEFPDGFRQNIIHTKKFIRLYEDRFGAVNVTKDDLLNQLRQVGVVRNERIYPRQDSKQKSLVDEICETVSKVFQNGGTCVHLSKLLERYEQQIGDQLGIYSEDDLQALLENNQSISFRWGYIFKDANFDPAHDVLIFMKSQHEPTNYDAIQSALWYLPMDRIKHELVTTESLVKVSQETYFYAPNLPISQDELQILTRVMNQRISSVGFLVGKDLKNIINECCPSAAIDLADMPDWAIRNCLSYVLREEFEFTGALISEKGHPLSAAEAYRNFCGQHRKLTLGQLKEFSTEINLPINWHEVFSVMVRISKDDMRLAANIQFDTDKVDAVLCELCNGAYISIREIRQYLRFPGIGVAWNDFVLESYLKNHSKNFQLFQQSTTENGVYGVVVRRKSEFKNYEQVVIDMLARSTAWKNQDDALSLLVDCGFQKRKKYAHFDEVIKQSRQLREAITQEKK